MATHFVTRLLLLEDDAADVQRVQAAIADAAPGAFDMTRVACLADALAALDAGRFDVMLSDLTVPDSDRLSTVKAIVTHSPTLPLVVLTGLHDEALGEAAILLGAQDYLLKGEASGPHIARTLRYAMDRTALELGLRDVNATLEHRVAERTAELAGTLVQLSESLATARALAETAPDAIITAGPTGVIVSWNRAAARMFGYSEAEAIGQPLTLLMPPRYRGPHSNGFRRAQEAGDGRLIEGAIEMHGLTKAGAEFPLELTLSTWVSTQGVQFIGIIRDITARKHGEAARADLQAQLTQSQKMESIGLLAGGVAHDFNNMLSAILSYTELTMLTLGDEHEVYPDLEEIRSAAQRSAGLTRQLLAFARKQAIEKRVLDLNDAGEGILKMLRRLLGEHVTISWVPGNSLWKIAADPTQMDQVLTNLAVNAKDAMRGGHLALEVSTKNVVLDAAFVAMHRGAQVGDFVRLTARDNGCGMDAHTLSRVFEPFFTTKVQGEGTGLGLSTVYGIVQQHGGFVDVESTPGVGTTFHLYIPRNMELAEERARTAPELPQRTETILLAEDEAGVRAATTDLLRMMGYTVLAASNGEEATVLAASHGAPIDLLLTDVIMPGMNGAQLRDGLQKERPELNVLFMSGYSDDVISLEGVLVPGTHYMPKPFTIGMLAGAVRHAIDG